MKVGDLVKIRYHEKYDDSDRVGVVRWILKEYPPACGIMFSNETAVYDTRHVEVISESR